MSAFRQYTTLPALPQPGLLDRYLDTLSVIVPVARTNEVTNPSFETGSTGYTVGAGSLARTTTQQYHGAYSGAYTPSAAVNDGFYFSPIVTTTGQTRAVSCKFLGAPGVPYKLSVATTGGVDLVATTFIGTGFWQWVWVFWTETGGATRRIYFTKNNSTSVATYYVDGVQSEVCGSEGVFVTTYIDGDQLGYATNQQPPAYLWTATPHASTSTRSGQTRAGGRVVKLRELGFFLATIVGLGMATPRNESQGFAQLDGAEYQNTIKPTRSLSLVGRWADLTPSLMDGGVARLGRRLDRDLIATRQPLALCLQARECNQDIGEFVTVPRAMYRSGLEGNTQELPSAAAAITFEQYLPYVVGRDGGVALTVQSTFTMAYMAQRNPQTGQWGNLGTGMNASVQSSQYGLNGVLYAGGSFTDAGGSGADFGAQWNGTAWSVLASATALNAVVTDWAISPSGLVYVAGLFINANANVNADFIASWDGTTWGNLSTGANNTVQTIAVGPDGSLYAGGDFTSIGGVAAVRIAKWNGTAWSIMGTGVGPNGLVRSIAVARDNTVYIGGTFTTVDGVATTQVAKWNGTAWSSIGAFDALDTIESLTILPDGRLYAMGSFNNIGAVLANNIAVWNGVVWSPLGSGVSSALIAGTLKQDAVGGIYAVSNFTSAGGIATPCGFAYWNGAAWVPGDIAVPGNNVYTMELAADGTIVLGGPNTGTATAAGITTATNNGSAATYPTLVIRGPSTGSSRIYQLRNVTTGASIYFNYTIQAGETATLVLDPANLSFTSTFQGNVFSTILPGSQTAQFLLQPGANTISFFAASSTVTAALQWQTRYLMLDDALYGAGDP